MHSHFRTFTRHKDIRSVRLSCLRGFLAVTLSGFVFLGQQSRRVQLRPASRDQSQQRRLRGGEPRRRPALLHASLREHLVGRRKSGSGESWRTVVENGQIVITSYLIIRLNIDYATAQLHDDCRLTNGIDKQCPLHMKPGYCQLVKMERRTSPPSGT